MCKTQKVRRKKQHPNKLTRYRKMKHKSSARTYNKRRQKTRRYRKQRGGGLVVLQSTINKLREEKITEEEAEDVLIRDLIFDIRNNPKGEHLTLTDDEIRPVAKLLLEQEQSDKGKWFFTEEELKKEQQEIIDDKIEAARAHQQHVAQAEKERHEQHVMEDSPSVDMGELEELERKLGMEDSPSKKDIGELEELDMGELEKEFDDPMSKTRGDYLKPVSLSPAGLQPIVAHVTRRRQPQKVSAHKKTQKRQPLKQNITLRAIKMLTQLQLKRAPLLEKHLRKQHMTKKEQHNLQDLTTKISRLEGKLKPLSMRRGGTKKNKRRLKKRYKTRQKR